MTTAVCVCVAGVSLEWIDEAWKKSIGWTHGPLELIDIMGLSTLNSSSPQDDVEAKVFAFIDRLKEKNVSKIYCSDSYSSLSTEFQAIVLECVQQVNNAVIYCSNMNIYLYIFAFGISFVYLLNDDSSCIIIIIISLEQIVALEACRES